MLSIEDARKLYDLAQIGYTEAQLAQMADDLSRMAEVAGGMARADVADSAEAVLCEGGPTPLRPDVPGWEIPNALALSLAGESASGLYKVPRATIEQE